MARQRWTEGEARWIAGCGKCRGLVRVDRLTWAGLGTWGVCKVMEEICGSLGYIKSFSLQTSREFVFPGLMYDVHCLALDITARILLCPPLEPSCTLHPGSRLTITDVAGYCYLVTIFSSQGTIRALCECLKYLRGTPDTKLMAQILAPGAWSCLGIHSTGIHGVFVLISD